MSPAQDEARHWELIASAWHQVDAGGIAAALADGAVVAPADLEPAFGRFVAALVTRLDAMPLAQAEAAVERHRDLVRALEPYQLEAVVGPWMYDQADEAVAVIPLLGEGFFRRVVADPEASAVLAPAAGLGAIGGWSPLARPLRARLRASLLAEIPRQFADVPYPGDDHVTSGDWPTDEECRYFCGKDWRSLDRSALYRRHADISFVTPRGLQYLLPAFLVAALEDADGSLTAGLSILESLLFKLSHGDMGACVALLTAGQREVVGAALRLDAPHWQYGPLAEPDDDLTLALARLDPS